MKTSLKFLCAAVALGALAGCHDYLTGGDLTNDPNRPVVASNGNLLVGIETNMWGIVGGDPARTTGIFAQQFTGAGSQYQSNIETYQITEDNTNGAYASVYGGGGLVDVKKLEAGATAAKDTVFLGVAQVYEGFLMGTAADLFGDVVYSEAIQGTPNPKLDDQLAVYDSVQKVLSAAIVNLGKTELPGLADADIEYGGDQGCYIALAHTLKARFYMHTAEVRPNAYAQALAEAKQGITSDACDFVGRFNSSSGQQNFYYQFEVTAGRSGYVVPNAGFIALLESRNDPRRAEYFNAKGTDLSATRKAPDFQQPYVTYDENTLIWAEAAYRTGDEVTALAKLNEERANHGLAPEAVTGQALLKEILTEEYIADFQLGLEAFNLYNRTCFPNLVPTGTGKIPGRLYYDSSERQTDTNIPQPGTAPNTLRNRDNPPNATSDGTGAACIGQ
ncbi:MAG TPA: SusD/RagB family nutrient-binding outer membrane lipoprotein [Gemmatimonadaceae bacterium]|nr:SusD/RagB family nutrient-binding outer membrane lipoprotein [Gemmatimonadaceae bacterium]